jgi:hypothetical protein
MKLDAKNIRHLATEDWRVLQAVCRPYACNPLSENTRSARTANF